MPSVLVLFAKRFPACSQLFLIALLSCLPESRRLGADASGERPDAPGDFGDAVVVDDDFVVGDILDVEVDANFNFIGKSGVGIVQQFRLVTACGDGYARVSMRVGRGSLLLRVERAYTTCLLCSWKKRKEVDLGYFTTMKTDSLRGLT